MPINLNLDQRRFNQLALTAVAIGFALLIVGFVTTVMSTVESQRASHWVQHSYKVADALDRLVLVVDRSESASRGYLLSPDPLRLKTRKDNFDRILPTFDEARALTADNPRHQRALNQLSSLLITQIAASNSIMDKATTGHLAEAREEFAATSHDHKIEQVRNLVRGMRVDEDRLLALREQIETDRHRQLIAILAVTGVLLVLIAGAAFWLVRRYTIDLTRTRDRLNLLNADLEGAVARRTTELQRANDEIQKFAYIVSHDLRSPLVNVMGFTAELEAANAAIGPLVDRAETEHPELVTDDVRNAREDLPEAIGFIRASTQKMDRLITAILQLSRQGRRVLTPEPIDMKGLIEDIIASLEHRLGEVGATATVEGALPDLTSDRLAVEQIFSNLLDNAVKYLEPARPGRLVVRGHAESGGANFEVEDNGRGIDPRDHERVFELFRRAGVQNQPGEGIGLAHVRALMYRLGGSIDCDSELGRGSTFRLRFPVNYRDEGGEN